MPREFNLVVHTAYDDLYPVESWSSEADYTRARDFLKALVGGPHGVCSGRYAGVELYEIPTRAQVDDYRKFKQQLRKEHPEPDYSHVLLTQTFELTGPAGRTASEAGETFYLETREQLDALFALQRKLKAKRED
jgi:hypothetical protein